MSRIIGLCYSNYLSFFFRKTPKPSPCLDQAFGEKYSSKYFLL